MRKDAAPAYVAGTFDTTQLVGIDATALSSGLWRRLISGTVAAGVVRLG